MHAAKSVSNCTPFADAKEATTVHKLRLQRKKKEKFKDVEERCPITLEDIKIFPLSDVFTTSSGVQYHRPSLKRWLQKNGTLPHNNMSAATEINLLWGQDIAKKRGSLYRQINISGHLEQKSYEWFQNESLGLSFVSLVNFYLRRHFKDEILKEFEKFLYASMVFSLVVFIGSVIFGYRAKNQLNNLCSMTDEENKKAELGVDYYAAQACD